MTLENGLSSIKDYVIQAGALRAVRGVSNIVWSGRNVRKTSHFEFADFLALDIDFGISVNEAIRLFSEYRVLIVATKSHQLKKNIAGSEVACDRFRVIVPFARRVATLGDYEVTLDEVKRRFPFIDTSCTDAARYYHTSPGPVLYENYEGRCWPVSSADKRQNQKAEDKIFFSRHGTDQLSLTGLNGGLPTLRRILFPNLSGQFLYVAESRSTPGAARFLKVKRGGAPFLFHVSRGQQYRWYPNSVPVFRYRWMEGRSSKGVYRYRQKVNVQGYDRLSRGFIVFTVLDYRGSHWRWLRHFSFGEVGRGRRTRVWIPYRVSDNVAVEFKVLYNRIKELITEAGLGSLITDGADRPVETVELLPAEIKGLATFVAQAPSAAVSSEELEQIKKKKEWKRSRDLIRRHATRTSLSEVRHPDSTQGSGATTTPSISGKIANAERSLKSRIKFVAGAQDLLKNSPRARGRKTLGATIRALLVHPRFWTPGHSVPAELKISQRRLVEIARQIDPRHSVKRTAVRRHIEILEELGYITKIEARGYVPRQQSFSYRIHQRFIDEVVLPFFQRLKRCPPNQKKKLLSVPDAPALDVVPEAGLWNELVFRATNYFADEVSFFEYFWRCHRNFLNEKPERIRQMRTAWKNHHNRTGRNPSRHKNIGKGKSAD